ncbi:hypothetical protein TUMSATVNIG1_13840 [Vibrio nigripulchritudo]|uniref:DMP19 family protein n=1 Tax=Vibrio nigripulchritudo TaxID=28173 RepID=UPI00190B7DDB|nr:DUF4375 domain-containing protein [Vibrio nigripulchritudo]BCL69435.1 hypothetical protein VNTUMSATTG_13720 [Vibrio nigripulchritudo]BDU30775.1 hypothetical protein TUMSATVNIG1_13840 [Vibrio nigripulchritudo]
MSFVSSKASTDSMEDLIRRLYTKEESLGFHSLSDVEKNIVVVSSTLYAIDNGGLTDLCVNYSGKYINIAPKSFSAVGALEAAELLTNFVQWFGLVRPFKSRFLREAQFNFNYTRRSNEFDALDEEWDSSKLGIENYLEQYIDSCYHKN